MDRLLWMRCYVRAVETGSFSAVARELGIGQPNVSRHIAALESHLATRLLHRSTRKLSLTPEGERYYADAQRALAAVADAEEGVRGDAAPSGLLRVACPTALARFKLLPLVTPFLRRYPAITLDVQIADRMVDLVEEGVDVAIRVRELKDSALRARRLAIAPRVCVASRAYLRAHPRPKRPADLVHHNCLRYSLLASGNVWPFVDEPVTVSGNLRVNSPEGIRCGVADGLGIGLTPRWLFEDLLESRKVVALLADWAITPVPIHALYPERRLLPLRAKAFMDFVAEAFAADASLRLS